MAGTQHERGHAMTEASDHDAQWTRWRVADGSGFEVDDPTGNLGLVQIDAEQFLVTRAFRFRDDAVQQRLVDLLVKDGATPDEARRRVDAGRTFTPTEENPTDLASIPAFMRWFENPYGRHTLAAIIHDELIRKEPNTGELGSDTVSDTFFREMMRSAGVPWLKRWIMWAAVALRTRFAAGGWRRISLLVWLVLAVVGIASFVIAAGDILFDWGRPTELRLLIAIAVVLPVVSAPLWGRQYGASFVAAVAALWILPAAILAAAGYATYRILEGGAAGLGYD